MWEASEVESLNSQIGTNLRRPYTQVHVLLITWAENDLEDVDQEIRDLRELFEKDFKYVVSHFPIPRKQPQAQLNLEITSLVRSRSEDSDSLVIVYYAGHCGPDQKGKAVWYAFEEEGPMVLWHTTQSCLFAAQGDVLLILDSCHASLITEGSKTGGGRFELLAASAIGRLTPRPGPRSFTKALIRLLRGHAKDGINSESLASLLREDKRITETPVFHDFVRESPKRIQLQRLEQQGLSDRFKPKPTGYLFFRASMSGDPVGMQIADWLKTAPPKSVTAVHIEAVVSQARKIQEVGDKGQFSDSSLFSKLSGSAQSEIRRAIRDLNQVMATSTDCAGTIPLATVEEDGEAIEETFEQLRATVSAVVAAIETPLLLQNESSHEDLEVSIKETPDSESSKDKFGHLMAVADFKTTMDLHKAITSADPCKFAQEIPSDSICHSTHARANRRLRRFEIGTVNGIRTISEVFTYENTSQTSGDPSAKLLQQIRKITGLLCHPKYNVFHTLPCLGYYRNRLRKEIGMVFKAPPATDFGDGRQVVTLLDLYKHGSYRVVPLGTRVHLACSLVMAIEHFHRVGWLHKSIRSGNVAFLPEEDHEICAAAATTTAIENCVEHPIASSSPMNSFNLRNPLLFGFEYSRASDEATYMDEDHKLVNNIYRHPERWGRPSARFHKKHDIYSLGVLLFEIAQWKEVMSVLKKPTTAGGSLGSTEVLQAMIRKCDNTLPHQVGEVFTRCIKNCLEIDMHTKDMSEYDEHVYFQKHIVNPLERAVGRI